MAILFGRWGPYEARTPAQKAKARKLEKQRRQEAAMRAKWAADRAEREERERKEWALGDYDNGETGCPHCGRSRLCLCPNGKHRCEKCNWSPELNDYAPVND